MRFQRLVGATWTNLPGCPAANGTTRTCTFNTASVADGSHDFRVTAVASSVTYTDVQTGVQIDNTAPTTSLSVPAAPLSGTANLTATATDSGTGVVSVSFQYRVTGAPTWSECGVDNSSPYACALDTNAIAEGSYQFQAVATDGIGNVRTTGAQTRIVDRGDPSVSLTVPSAPLSGSPALSATAADGGGIASVAFRYRASGTTTWTTSCTDNNPPYTCGPNTGGWTDGTYEFQALATDIAGKTATSAPIESRMVDNNNPSVALTVPSGALRGTVSISATANDGNGIASVLFEYRPAGGAWTTCTTDNSAPYECTVNTTGLANGNHEFRATATDNANRTASSSVTRMVDNLAPTTSLSVPAGPLSNSVTLTATTADAHSGVATVLFEYRLVGGPTWMACGTDSAAGGGYTCALDTTALNNGNYEFRAISTDVAGNSTTSATVGPRTVTNTTLGVDVQATNANSQAQAGDSVIFTFNRRVDPASIKAGWNGMTGTSVNVSFSSQAFAGGPVAGRDWAGFNVNLGTVAFQQNYLNGNNTGAFTQLDNDDDGDDGERRDPERGHGDLRHAVGHVHLRQQQRRHGLEALGGHHVRDRYGDPVLDRERQRDRR